MIDRAAPLSGEERQLTSDSSVGTYVVAIVVTYGTRADLVVDVVDASLAAGCDHIVLVDNASPPSNAQLLEQLANRCKPTVSLVRNDRNEGSAGGFARGLEEARKRNPKYFWLLDDDNLAEQNALSEAVKCAEHAKIALGRPELAVSSLRISNWRQVKAAETGSTLGIYPRGGSYIYFDLRDKVNFRARTRTKASPRAGFIELPYGPYGGLLVTRGVPEKVGGPSRELILYEDDTEFTSRIQKNQIPLILEPKSRIRDLEAKWTDQRAARGPVRLLFGNEPKKLYFAIRNRVRYDRAAAVEAQSLSWLVVNGALYSLYCLGASAVALDFRPLSIFVRAAWHGLRNDLSKGPLL